MRTRLWRPDGTVQGTSRSGGEARELLAAGHSPEVILYPRSDGPGSSQDLPQFQAMGSRLWSGLANFEDPAWRWSKGTLRTPGACLDAEPIRFKALPASREDQVEYYSPDFHSAPISSGEVVPGIKEQFVNNILAQFGMFGVRIEAEPMPAVYRGTGLGGSNLAHAAALILASALSGTDLSLAQIYVWGTALENNFGVSRQPDGSVLYGVSITGGQEMLTAFQGGVFDNVHVPFVFGPHAVVSRELVEPKSYGVLEDHLALINIGRRRKEGVTSAGVNTEWMAGWADEDHAAKHLRKAELAYDSAEALRQLDFNWYADVIRKYRQLRTALCAGYTAGQEALEELCREYGAEYFPVGAGGGTCLVCAPEAEGLRGLAERLASTEDRDAGRTMLPFRVREQGAEFTGFTEAGLNLPAMPDDRGPSSSESSLPARSVPK